MSLCVQVLKLSPGSTSLQIRTNALLFDNICGELCSCEGDPCILQSNTVSEMGGQIYDQSP